MPRPPTSQGWARKIEELAENHLDWTVKELLEELEKHGARESWADVPSPSTVGRIRRKHLAKPERERAPFLYVEWPGTFNRGLLDWADSRDVLNLLGQYALFGRRPTVANARWFLR